MAQWVNHLWNNIFVNPLPLPLLCEISGALHLAQLGLRAAWWVGSYGLSLVTVLILKILACVYS